MERFRWWEFTPHPEWLEQHASERDCFKPFAAGIPREIRVIFLPILGNFGWGETLVKGIEPDVSYRAFYYDPIIGDEYDQGAVRADKCGRWRAGKVRILQDWVLVLEKT